MKTVKMSLALVKNLKFGGYLVLTERELEIYSIIVEQISEFVEVEFPLLEQDEETK